MVNEWTALGIGIALAIIFAQTTILNVSTTFALDIIFSPDNWWIRSIMIVLVFGFLTVSYVVSQLIAKHIKLSFKSTSRHLRILFTTGIVDKEQVNLSMLYSIADPLPKLAERVLNVVD